MIPLPHLPLHRMLKKWKFHEEIIWSKVTGGLDRFGVTIQHPYPTYYKANIMHKHILTLRKGPTHHKRNDNSKLIIDEITKKDTSNSIWNIAPVPPKFINYARPSPKEIPYRLIALYSNVSCVVLDPFVGSGQTTKVARYLKRHYIGVDNVKEYVEMAKKMLSEAPHLREQLIAKWQKIPIT